jgi:hypothetical protein
MKYAPALDAQNIPSHLRIERSDLLIYEGFHQVSDRFLQPNAWRIMYKLGLFPVLMRTLVAYSGTDNAERSERLHADVRAATQLGNADTRAVGRRMRRDFFLRS